MFVLDNSALKKKYLPSKKIKIPDYLFVFIFIKYLVFKYFGNDILLIDVLKK